LQRLGDVVQLDVRNAIQVGDRPREFENAVIGAGAEL
jgi:hypothetical protein